MPTTIASNPLAARMWRRWGPYGLLLLVPIPAAIGSPFVDGPTGHWSGHLDSAFMNVGMGAAILVGLILVARRAGVLLCVLGAVVILGCGVQVSGNVRVAQSIWQTTYGDEDVANLSPAPTGLDAGHDRAARGDQLVFFGGIVFTISAALTRRVSERRGIAAFVFSLVPPWILGGLGVLVALIGILQEAMRAPIPIATPVEVAP